MKKLLAVLLFNVVGIISFGQNEFVSITRPQQMDTISGYSTLIMGKAALQNGAHLYVLIHPLLDKNFYVQPKPSTINSDSTWTISGFFGTKSQGNNEYFEIIAIITKQSYTIGQTFLSVPNNLTRSNAITVFRLDGSK